MRDIAKLNENDKKALFHNTAAKMGMTDAIIEKDFWVCYMLDYLFHRCAWKNNIAFKGGTSLSKSYGCLLYTSKNLEQLLCMMENPQRENFLNNGVYKFKLFLEKTAP